VRNETPELTIGEVATAAGVRTSRIRYYESVGVLPQPARVSGRRRYTVETIDRLATIAIAQQVGFTLDEIRDLITPGRGPAHERLRELARRKLPEIDEVIERAVAIKHWLEMTSACECESLEVCSLFDPQVANFDSRAYDGSRAHVLPLPPRARESNAAR
jgi:MerR family transcriptional regulator, redox-sensitive transcriptional activator SoxR